MSCSEINLLKNCREFLTKCKIVVLYEMHKNPVTRYTQLNKLEQQDFKRLVTILYGQHDEYEVTKRFNEIVCGAILEESIDPSIYPVLLSGTVEEATHLSKDHI